MIEAKHIVKSFDGRIILHDISATFYEGKTNLIIGQSGSGKTVLMKSLVGLIKPEEGEILYDGRDFMKFNSDEIRLLRSEIGMLFQGSALFDSMTVIENVMFPLLMFTDQSYQQRKKRAEFCLERVNLKGANKLYPCSYCKSYCPEPQISVLRRTELGYRPADIACYRRTCQRHYARIQHNHYYKYPRHELRYGYRGKHSIPEQRVPRLARDERRDFHIEKRVAQRLRIRLQPAERGTGVCRFEE